MKKNITLLFWIALGFLLIEISGFLFGTTRGAVASAIDFVLWWSCFFVGVIQYLKLKRLEKIKILLDSGFYDVSVIQVMPKEELNLRFKFQKNNPSEDFSGLTINQLKARRINDFKDSAIKGIELTGRGLKASLDGVKVGLDGVKAGVDGVKTGVKIFSDGYSEGREEIRRSEIKDLTASSSTPRSVGGGDVGDAAYDKRKPPQNKFDYKTVKIREYEDEIFKLKSKIDETIKYYKEYSAVGDTHNNRVADSWLKEKAKLESELRRVEQELHKAVLDKRFADDFNN